MMRGSKYALLTGALLLQCAAFAQESDLSQDNAVSRGTAEAVIYDTTLVDPQVQASSDWKGKVTLVKEHLPPHSKPDLKFRRENGENDLPFGGLSGEVNTTPGPLFPGISQTPWTPPDPTLAVGPTHIVETVNMALAFYNKSTGALEFSQNLDNTGNPGFFEDVGAGNFTFDPKCFYDHYAGRFVIVALEVYGSTQAFIDIAVSDDSNPNGTWYKYRTDARIPVGSCRYWVDYPGFGYDHQGYYVTGNLFLLSGNCGGFGGAVFRIFNKTPLLTGQPATFSDLRDGSAYSVQAAQSFDSPATPYFVQDWSTTQIKIHAIRDPLGTPSLVSAVVTVPSYAYPSGGAPNQGGSSIDVLDGRIINVSYRGGRLYAGHGVRLNSKNMARWYEFAVNNWPASGSPTLTQSGNIDGGSGVHTWFPALAENECGDVGIVVAMSSSSTKASVQVTGRRSSDPPGTMGALTQLAVGTSGYNGGRWGDYFDIAVDPSDDTTFWVVGEYATSTSNWATWIGGFQVSDCGGGGNICDDVQAFTAKCKRTGKIVGKVVFTSTAHDGETVTISIDGQAFNATVANGRGKVGQCCYSGNHTVALDDPAGCKDPIVVTCP